MSLTTRHCFRRLTCQPKRIGGIRILAIEILKPFHSLNPTYTNEIFQTNPSITRNLYIVTIICNWLLTGKIL